jgi:hypothetical protein
MIAMLLHPPRTMEFRQAGRSHDMGRELFNGTGVVRTGARNMRIEIKCDPNVARIVKGELELLRFERPRPSPNTKPTALKRKFKGKRTSSKPVR